MSIKKVKSNPCIVCLGLLQDFTIEDVLNNSALSQSKAYDSKVFTCSISMPASILVREHNLKINLQEKYPEFFDDGKTILYIDD